MANSNDRSKYQKFDRKAKTEDFKRVPGAAGMSEVELKKAEWTGVRKSDMTCEYQFWILGSKVKTVSFIEQELNKNALHEAHVEVFAMAPEKNWLRGLA